MNQSGFCNACGVAAEAEALRCANCGAMLPPSDDPRDPRRVARALAETLGAGYEVVDEAGRGGFARVFRVRDLTLDRWLAAKVIAPELTASPDATERFRHEAMTVARLVHPNIVPIYFVPASAALACYVMPLVSGESLAARLKREGALPLSVAVGIAQDVAAALDAAHAAGVVHRDVKPDNILLEFQSGRALLTDFGIARAPRPGGRITTTGHVLGTPHYVAPEQAAGERELDGRTDQYALAVVLFEMLAGRPPFDATTAQALYALHVAAPRPDLRQWRPEVPPAATGAIERALAQDPAERFPSAGAFAAAVSAGLGRRSLRSSGSTVVERQATGDVRMFRATTSDTVIGDARAALAAPTDLGAFRDAVQAVVASLAAALRSGEVARVAEVVRALAASSRDERPAFRQEAITALRACGANAAVVEALGRLWGQPGAGVQAAAEEALASLMPEAGAALIALARRDRRAELLLLADRTGALGEQDALALVRDPSAGVAGLLIGVLVESQRAPEAVERWLGAALRHPHAEVRRAALATSVQRGGALAERLGRLGLSDRDAAVRLAALDALGASRRREAIPDLAVVLEASTATEQRRAAEALGQLGVAEAIGPLRRALSRRRLFGFRVSPVEEAALDALARLPGQDAASELQALAARTGHLGALARQALDRHSGAVPRP
jgi:HEAT repeat protein